MNGRQPLLTLGLTNVDLEASSLFLEFGAMWKTQVPIQPRCLLDEPQYL